MKNDADSRYLRSSGRRVSVPFCTKVVIEGQVSELICTQVLRVLQGKRLVCFGEWERRPLVIKFFFDPHRANRHCHREEKGIRALLEGGVLAPELLFKGTLLKGGTPVLGLEKIEPSRDLAAEWAAAVEDTRRGQLLIYAVATIARQHIAGLKQEDPYRKNFLLAETSIYSIDGDGINTSHKGKPLSKRQSLKSLAHFLAQFYPRYDHLFEVVFKRYQEERNWKRPLPLDVLTRYVGRQFNRRKKVRLKKIFRASTALTCRKKRFSLTLCDREYDSNTMTEFLSNPDRVMTGVRVLKAGKNSTVALIEIDGRRLVAKEYHVNRVRQILSGVFKGSRARFSWRNAHLLKLLFLRTAKPVALKEARLGTKGYYVCEYLPGRDISNLFLKDHPSREEKDEVISQLGEMIQAFANARVSHGELSPADFIWHRGKLFVVDLDRLRQHRWQWRFRRAFKEDRRRLTDYWTNQPETAGLFEKMFSKVEW
jgi:tRNA A-37 threonylcarbamoyl transferase component Bud32